MCFSAAELYKLRVKECILHFFLFLTAWSIVLDSEMFVHIIDYINITK